MLIGLGSDYFSSRKLLIFIGSVWINGIAACLLTTGNSLTTYVLTASWHYIIATFTTGMHCNINNCNFIMHNAIYIMHILSYQPFRSVFSHNNPFLSILIICGVFGLSAGAFIALVPILVEEYTSSVDLPKVSSIKLDDLSPS